MARLPADGAASGRRASGSVRRAIRAGVSSRTAPRANGQALCRREELSGIGLERRCDFEDIREARIASSALNAADVGAVQPARKRQAFLRYAPLLAGPTDSFAERRVRRRSNRHIYSFPS